MYTWIDDTTSWCRSLAIQAGVDHATCRKFSKECICISTTVDDTNIYIHKELFTCLNMHWIPEVAWPTKSFQMGTLLMVHPHTQAQHVHGMDMHYYTNTHTVSLSHPHG